MCGMSACAAASRVCEAWGCFWIFVRGRGYFLVPHTLSRVETLMSLYAFLLMARGLRLWLFISQAFLSILVLFACYVVVTGSEIRAERRGGEVAFAVKPSPVVREGPGGAYILRSRSFSRMLVSLAWRRAFLRNVLLS